MSVLALSAAGCTGGGAKTPSPTPSSGAGSSPALVTSNAPAVFKAGQYSYAFNSIMASLALHGSDGTLKIHNGSGAEIGSPGLYVITGDDRRFDGTVAGAAPIPDGGDATLEVTFPAQVTAKTVGLVIFLLGADNMGALAPVVEG